MLTKKGKLVVELSEKRERMNELLTVDELTTEQRAEMVTITGRLQELEPELRAAIVEEETRDVWTEGTPEARELAALVTRASLGAIFAATMEHRQTEGAERELQEHHRLAGNQVPLALLRGPVEHRATGVTAAPADVAQNQASIIPAVFPMSCAAFLGVSTPTVGVGESVYPVLSTSADAGTPAENADQDETAGAFEASVLSPGRIQASFRYSREDRSRFRGMDEALRMNLSDALADKLDQQIINGTNGLLNGTVLANNNVTTATTFALYMSQFGYGRCDGKYASTPADLRIVMGSASFAHCGTTYRHQNADDLAIDRLMAITGGVKVSSHVPALASTRQNAIVRLGMRQDAIAPLWEGITILVDEVTKAAGGQIVLTAIMLHAIKVLRAAGFHKQQVQTS